MDETQKKEQIFCKLQQAVSTENMFSRIMRAATVRELIDCQFRPQEIIPLFHAAEELARYEEETFFAHISLPEN